MIERRMRADAVLALCSLIWGATFVVVRGGLGYVSVFLFLALRFSLATVLMAVFRPRGLKNLKRDQVIAGAALGLFMFGGYAFQTAGLQYTTPAKSGFVTGSSVVFVPLLLGIFWRRRLTPWVYAGTFAAVGGLYFLTVPVEGLVHLNHGDLLTLCAAALYGVHIILVSDYTRKHSVAALSVLQMAACAALAWITMAGAALTKWQPARLEWRWESAAAIGICAVFATAIAFSMQLWAQQYTSPSHAAILFTLEPVFALIASYLVIAERLNGRGVLGGVFVLAGILIAELLGPAAAPESPEPMAEASAI